MTSPSSRSVLWTSDGSGSRTSRSALTAWRSTGDVRGAGRVSAMIMAGLAAAGFAGASLLALLGGELGVRGRAYSAAIASGILLETSACARSIKTPVGCPFPLRMIFPPGGSGVARVMPAAARAASWRLPGGASSARAARGGRGRRRPGPPAWDAGGPAAGCGRSRPRGSTQLGSGPPGSAHGRRRPSVIVTGRRTCGNSLSCPRFRRSSRCSARSLS